MGTIILILIFYEEKYKRVFKINKKLDKRFWKESLFVFLGRIERYILNEMINRSKIKGQIFSTACLNASKRECQFKVTDQV